MVDLVEGTLNLPEQLVRVADRFEKRLLQQLEARFVAVLSAPFALNLADNVIQGDLEVQQTLVRVEE